MNETQFVDQFPLTRPSRRALESSSRERTLCKNCKPCTPLARAHSISAGSKTAVFEAGSAHNRAACRCESWLHLLRLRPHRSCKRLAGAGCLLPVSPVAADVSTRSWTDQSLDPPRVQYREEQAVHARIGVTGVPSALGSVGSLNQIARRQACGGMPKRRASSRMGSWNLERTRRTTRRALCRCSPAVALELLASIVHSLLHETAMLSQ